MLSQRCDSEKELWHINFFLKKKEIIMKNILIKPVTQFTYWYFFIYHFPVLRNLGPDSVITNLHIVLIFSHSVLLVACWWIPYSQRHFPPQNESQNVHTSYQKCHFLRLGKPRDIGWPELNFARHIIPGNMYERDPYLCSIYIKFSSRSAL